MRARFTQPCQIRQGLKYNNPLESNSRTMAFETCFLFIALQQVLFSLISFSEWSPILYAFSELSLMQKKQQPSPLFIINDGLIFYF